MSREGLQLCHVLHGHYFAEHEEIFCAGIFSIIDSCVQEKDDFWHEFESLASRKNAKLTFDLVVEVEDLAVNVRDVTHIFKLVLNMLHKVVPIVTEEVV